MCSLFLNYSKDAGTQVTAAESTDSCQKFTKRQQLHIVTIPATVSSCATTLMHSYEHMLIRIRNYPNITSQAITPTFQS